MKTLAVAGKTYHIHSLKNLPSQEKIQKLPYTLKVLLENLLRFRDGKVVTDQDINNLITLFDNPYKGHEIAMTPARVLMQDFTGVPAVVDLAAMRDAMKIKGGDVSKINPLIPVDLVIDHSVMVDEFGNPKAFSNNVALEYARNKERYRFLKWGQKAFRNFRVVPPGTGICHQVNLEYLAQVVWTSEVDGKTVAYPDSLVGTDSHTTMINGLAVLGWGVGGIEAEACMLGQPLSMLIPEVVGMRLTGTLPEGITATDLVLTVTQILRKKGVVGKFVEFFGDGLAHLTLADRATIANMAPEYGATCGFFPIDQETLNYLHLSNRSEEQIALVEAYAKEQGLWRDESITPNFHDIVDLDLSTIQPSLAGPKRPQDKVVLKDLKATAASITTDQTRQHVVGENYTVANHDVVIAAITSCTNTSNPSVLIAAGLLAQKAVAKGLKTKPWVKTSLAPGSQVVTEYLEKSGLMTSLNALGFNLVGYGCTTCIGNSGPLPTPIAACVETHDLTVAGVLSGNRNFEGRINPHVKANYLASPPLVVAFAIAGTTHIDLTSEPIGENDKGEKIYLKDIWPSNAEIQAVLDKNLDRSQFAKRYATVFDGDAEWQKLQIPTGETYLWEEESTYVKHPPYFTPEMAHYVGNIENARVLGLFGDSITTDHISPAGSIKLKSPAGEYLIDHTIAQDEFNSYGARRGNHEIMMRGTFANIRLQNEITPDVTGGYTKYFKTGETQSIYDASMGYQADHTSLVVIAGKEYGTGSSRDWAAKGTRLLGVRAVIAESFERIHRSNLVGMGVLPLVFKDGENRKTLKLTGSEIIDLSGLEKGIQPRMNVDMQIRYADGSTKMVCLLCRIDTLEEVEYFNKGGILSYVLENLAA